jgi:hypothetical protein
MESGGPVSKLFEARVSDVRRKQFSGLTMGQWRFLFEDWQTQNVNTKGSPLPSFDNPTGLDPPLSQSFQACQCYLSMRLRMTRILRLNR